MEWFLGAIAVGAVVVVAILWWSRSDDVPGYSSSGQSSNSPGGSGYSVWSYERGFWTLTEDLSAQGYVPGPAPRTAGPCEGYCVKVVSVRGPGAR